MSEPLPAGFEVDGNRLSVTVRAGKRAGNIAFAVAMGGGLPLAAWGASIEHDLLMIAGALLFVGAFVASTVLNLRKYHFALGPGELDVKVTLFGAPIGHHHCAGEDLGLAEHDFGGPGYETISTPRWTVRVRSDVDVKRLVRRIQEAGGSKGDAARAPDQSPDLGRQLEAYDRGGSKELIAALGEFHRLAWAGGGAENRQAVGKIRKVIDAALEINPATRHDPEQFKSMLNDGEIDEVIAHLEEHAPPERDDLDLRTRFEPVFFVLLAPVFGAGVVALTSSTPDSQVGDLTVVWAIGALFAVYAAAWIVSRIGGRRQVRFRRDEVWLPAMGLGLWGRNVPYGRLRGIERCGNANRKLRITFEGGRRTIHSDIADIEVIQEELEKRRHLASKRR